MDLIAAELDAFGREAMSVGMDALATAATTGGRQ
jgi:hypothetical protein